MPSTPETILLGVRNRDKVVKIALPPRHRFDGWELRALECGKLYNIRHMLCSPDGEIYCVRGSDLYCGPMPSSKNSDWFREARRVGRQEWEDYRLLCFDPEGDLYAVTYNGDLCKGPKPVNENRPWLYDYATNHGRGKWDLLKHICFDPEGSLYAVTNYDALVKGPRPETTNNWLESSQVIGYGFLHKYTHFISIAPDGKLWCVDSRNGNLFKGDPPVSVDRRYFKYAEHIGAKFHNYKLCFVQDKTIHNIISLEFLPEKGEKHGENLEVIAEQIYDNRRSSSPLKHTFTFERKMIESSSFTQEHGFTCEFGIETTVTAGIPYVGEAETTVKVNTSTTHNWQFNKTNQKETTVSSSANLEIEPHRAVKVKASIMSAEIICPYEAEVETLFGNITRVKGTWKGTANYNLRVTQEDYDGL